jgi:hypothetical protein
VPAETVEGGERRSYSDPGHEDDPVLKVVVQLGVLGPGRERELCHENQGYSSQQDDEGDDV